MWTKLLQGHAICAAASFITIIVSQWLGLGAFATASWLVDLGLALGLTVFASVTFWGAAVALYIFNVAKPGILLHTVLTSFTGALAIWLGGMAFPSVVLVGSFAVALMLGIANTMLIWLISYTAGTAQTNIGFWPQFRSK